MTNPRPSTPRNDHSWAAGVAVSKMPARAVARTAPSPSASSWSGVDLSGFAASSVPVEAVANTSAQDIVLTDEQQRVVDAVLAGHDVIVDSVLGSGKTSTIQQLCASLNQKRPTDKLLYLTYSKLLREEAQRRVFGAKVTNYHGIVYAPLRQAGFDPGISESVGVFNRKFDEVSSYVDTYDVMIIDEYQDITEEYAELLEHLKSKNPSMQIVMVGDMEQKVRDTSRHNAQEFAKRFCVNPMLLQFTRSFRMGEDMGKRLSRAWGKPIKGVNPSQEVSCIGYNEAVGLLLEMADRPQDILCLGKNRGDMTSVLNIIEQRKPESFNKSTVYASTRQRGQNAASSQNAAIFTTFDASKGLERDTVFIFDYDEQNFDIRLGFDDADPVVLRNIFLVAASRGKRRVFFVNSDLRDRRPLTKDFIGDVPIERFVDLPRVYRAQYERPFEVDSMFDFKFVEHVEAAYDLLHVERVDDGTSREIVVDSVDGLIDLSGVLDVYQKYDFFENFRIMNQVVGGEVDDSNLGDATQEQLRLKMMLTEVDNIAKSQGRLSNAWDRSLAYVAAVTNYDRYVHQVTVRPSEIEMMAIRDRLRDVFVENEPGVQVQVDMLDGIARYDHSEWSTIDFVGVADVVKDETVYGIHFVDELTHPMFLRAAMLAVMAGCEYGIVWSTKTNERWRVRVPDEQSFLNAVILCVTKGNYRMYE